MNTQKLSIEEYRKLKEISHSSSEEDRGDPSLQVDYEVSDSSPIQSPRENNLKEVVSSEETTKGDSTNTTSGVSNKEEQERGRPCMFRHTPWTIPKRKSSTPVETLLAESGESSSKDSPKVNTVFDSNKPVEETILEELQKEDFDSDWPWQLDVTRHQHFINLKEGTPSLPGYGDARGFKEDPRDPSNTVYLSPADPDRAVYFQNLFWKYKFFDSKRLSNNRQALTQSWQAFLNSFNANPEGWHRGLDAKIQAFRENHRSLKGLMYDIHCRTVVEHNMPCGVRKYQCLYCPQEQRAMTDEELKGYSTLELTPETRRLIFDLDKRYSLSIDKETTLVHEPSRTHEPYRGYPSRGSSEAPKSSKRMDIRANVPGTLDSGYKVENPYGGGRLKTPRSTAYSPDYQSEALEEGEEYDPGSDRFSPSKAYRHYSSIQRAAAPVSSHSYASPTEVASQLRDFHQLEKELLTEKYHRSQLQTQIAEMRAQNLQTTQAVAELQKKLTVLEGDYRRSLNLLQQQGVLKGQSLLRQKRKSDDTFSNAQHKTSDAGAST
jgi:hypothetical protein